MKTRNIDDYLDLPYTIEVVRDHGKNYSGWFARVVELPGCMTQADTFAELGDMIQDAMRAWIGAGIDDGQEIPEPVEKWNLKRKEENMKTKLIMIALVICTLLSIACTSNSWKITSKVDCDEYPVYTLRNGNNTMLGVPAGGSKKVPPVGTTCKLSGMVFDCGSKWQDLNAYYLAPN